MKINLGKHNYFMHVKVEIKNFVEINRISSNTCNRYKWIVIIKTKQKKIIITV